MPVKKKPRPPYRKPDSVRDLERMADAEVQKRYENVEAKYLCPRRYRDDDANSLTRCVIDFLNLSGHMAERINCTGRYMDRSQTFEDVTGKVRTIGTGQWIPTSGMKGTADISATINGRSVKIEIKMKDKQSEVQREYQRRIEAAGGVYLIVRSFAEFMTWYNTFTVPNE
jgi:hypothetical protein